MRWYNIKIHNVGNKRLLQVADDDGLKRPAVFDDRHVEEAIRVIKTLRIDSAFVDAVRVEQRSGGRS